MSAPPSTEGPARSGRQGKRDAATIVLLLSAFVVVAVIKPWGGSQVTTPTPSVDPAPIRQAAATTSPTPTEATSPTEPPQVGFVTPRPPEAGTPWTGLRWRRMSPDDPLALVSFTMRWERGFVAFGQQSPDSPQLVWTSDDGSHWDPLPVHGASTFPLGADLRAIVAGDGVVVALTQATTTGGDGSVMLWVSGDGRHWANPVSLPADFQVRKYSPPPRSASGPRGLLLAPAEVPQEPPPGLGVLRTLLLSDANGGWQSARGAPLPAGFEVTDLQGTADGYVAAGVWDQGHAGGCGAGGGTPTCVVATMWSPDGLRWPNRPTPLPLPGGFHSGVGAAFAQLLAGRDGLIAERFEPGPGETQPEVWWQSSDGRHWRPLPSFQPLGATKGVCDSLGCYPRANGHLIEDGGHLVALRTGGDAAAWDSTDGRTWRRLAMTGDVPDVASGFAFLWPGGVSYFAASGSSTWFGEAVVR